MLFRSILRKMRPILRYLTQSQLQVYCAKVKLNLKCEYLSLSSRTVLYRHYHIFIYLVSFPPLIFLHLFYVTFLFPLYEIFSSYTICLFFSPILCNFFIIYFLIHCSPMEVDTDIHMDAMAFGMGMCCLVSEGHYLAISK